MEKMTISDIARALNIPCPGEGEITGICTDSRQVAPGCLFVAIQGENFDATTSSRRRWSRGRPAPWPTVPGTGRRGRC